MTAWRIAPALAICLITPAAGWAGESALAETLYQDGRALLARGRTAEACAKFEESLRLDQATGTLLNLAACHEDLGKIATAWAEFQAAASSASHDRREDRTRFAREHLRRIEPRLSYLVISVSEAEMRAVAGLKITLDGTVLGAPSWNLALPIDPGTHVVMAHAPGYSSLSRAANVDINPARHAVVVNLVPLVDGQKNRVNDGVAVSPWLVPGAASPAADAAVSGRSSVPATGSARVPPLKLAAYVLTAGGGGALVVATVFGIRAFSKWNQRNVQCPAEICSDVGIHDYDQARTAALTADIALAVGAAALALGGYLLYRAPSKADETKRDGALNLRPAAVSLTKSGLAMGWTW